jgi:hypothetical protein
MAGLRTQRQSHLAAYEGISIKHGQDRSLSASYNMYPQRPDSRVISPSKYNRQSFIRDCEQETISGQPRKRIAVAVGSSSLNHDDIMSFAKFGAVYCALKQTASLKLSQ